MRRIISKANQKKKQRRNQIIISGILIFVMFFSVLGYGFLGRDNQSSNKLDYNGYEFIKQNEIWYLELGDFDFAFKNNPQEVEEITSQLKPLDNYLDKPLYIYSENKETEIEIYMNLQQIAQRIQYACLNEDECEGDLPIKTCEENFIIIQKDEINEIVQENNCVFIRGKTEKLLELSDEFLFNILEIR